VSQPQQLWAILPTVLPTCHTYDISAQTVQKTPFLIIISSRYRRSVLVLQQRPPYIYLFRGRYLVPGVYVMSEFHKIDNNEVVIKHVSEVSREQPNSPNGHKQRERNIYIYKIECFL
jgi:hypothetical protein